MYYDWEVDSGLFLSQNFEGNIAGDFPSTSVFSFYGDYNRIYNDYYLVGYRPNIFNITYIEEHLIDVIYINQINMLREEWRGRSENIYYLLESREFNRVYSNYYSTLLYKTDAR
jgi:hypothetical protein